MDEFIMMYSVKSATKIRHFFKISFFLFKLLK